MNKKELVEKVSGGSGLSLKDSGAVIDGLINAIKASLKKGQKVTLVGFGTFSVIKRKARKGRNPKTGEAIKIPAGKSPKFTAGKELKEAVKK